MTKQPVELKKYVGTGPRLREARERRGLKQSDLANLVKKNLRTIVRWETGGGSVSEGDLMLIASNLRISPKWLAHGEGPIELEGTFSKYFPSLGERLRSSNSDKEMGAPPISASFDYPTLYPKKDISADPEASEYGPCTSEEGTVDWYLAIAAYNEAMAYIEMEEEFSGRVSRLRNCIPRATMTIYHALQGRNGGPLGLRDMNDLLRGI